MVGVLSVEPVRVQKDPCSVVKWDAVFGNILFGVGIYHYANSRFLKTNEPNAKRMTAWTLTGLTRREGVGF